MTDRGSPTLIDTYAEAFEMRYARLWVTAHDDHWLGAAIAAVTGDACSVIGCDAEIGVEHRLSGASSPDGRPGASLLFFAFSKDALAKALVRRVGQCLMTCPTTAVFDGLAGVEKRVPLGKSLRLFGDGYQKSKLIEGRRGWRIPVMDGEFWVADEVGFAPGIGGGNVILQARDLESGLAAAREAVECLRDRPGVITPFPGGVARSGSKVGSRYRGLVASTAEAYCPTLRGRVDSMILPEAQCALEIVIDGVDREAVAGAMTDAITVLMKHSLVAIGAGNYGGKLGKHLFALRDLIG